MLRSLFVSSYHQQKLSSVSADDVKSGVQFV